MELPPCGLYRTTEAIAGVPANRLVYFHNHGDPGPGIYLPERWDVNRARFARGGKTLPDTNLAFTLEPLPAEGLYRVLEQFTCCEKNCRTFPENLLVQLGYNAEAQPLLFIPEWTEKGLSFPEMGTRLDPDRLRRIAPLKVVASKPPDDGHAVH